MKREQSECIDCPIASEIEKRLAKIDDIHAALYGLSNQPELGLIKRVNTLETFKKNVERNQFVQVGMVLGAGISGGGISALIIKYLS